MLTRDDGFAGLAAKNAIGHPASLVFCQFRHGAEQILWLGQDLIFQNGLVGNIRVFGSNSAHGSVELLALAWVAGTFLPFELASIVLARTSYLYYMVIVMPGIYVAAAYLVALGWRRRSRWLSALTIVWGLGVLVAVVLLYPFVAVF